MTWPGRPGGGTTSWSASLVSRIDRRPGCPGRHNVTTRRLSTALPSRGALIWRGTARPGSSARWPVAPGTAQGAVRRTGRRPGRPEDPAGAGAAGYTMRLARTARTASHTTEAGVALYLESITAGGDCAVLRIDGEIDACAAPQLRERVTGLAGNGTVHLIADLRGAGFLDVAGLGALVGSRKALRARGGSLALVASTGRVLQVLRITGLSDAFALHSCVADAITADRHWQAAVSGEGGSTGEWCREHGLP